MDGDGPKTAAAVAAAEGDRNEVAERVDDDGDERAARSVFERLFGFLTKSADEDGLAEAIENGGVDAVRRLPRARREMIERVIAFDEKRVDDVMAPRADIIAVDIETPLDDLVRAFAEAGHSRLPIYRDDLDDPRGMVHLKDVIALVAKRSEGGEVNGPILKTIRRDILYVPPSMRVTDLLLKMQASRIHMALVIDEYGGTDGLLTIEDLVEEIVGDINDEHDEDEAPTIEAHPGGWDADARVELVDFSEQTGVSFIADDEEVDTLGGFLSSFAGRVPQRGEVLSHPSGFDFEVLEADARRIRRIRIRGRHKAGETSEATTQI